MIYEIKIKELYTLEYTQIKYDKYVILAKETRECTDQHGIHESSIYLVAVSLDDEFTKTRKPEMLSIEESREFFELQDALNYYKLFAEKQEKSNQDYKEQ